MAATDPVSNNETLGSILEKYGLAHVESWAFTEDHAVEKLRFTIDPEWYGELPRTYIYDSDLKRIGGTSLLPVN